MEKWVVGSTMRTYDRYEARDSYEHAQDTIGENVQIGNAETESNGRILQETPLDFASTMRSLMAKMQSYKEDNERLVKAQEEQNQLNAAMLQSLTDIQINMNSKDRIEEP